MPNAVIKIDLIRSNMNSSYQVAEKPRQAKTKKRQRKKRKPPIICHRTNRRCFLPKGNGCEINSIGFLGNTPIKYCPTGQL